VGLAATARLSKSDITQAVVKRVVTDETSIVPILWEFHRTVAEKKTISMVSNSVPRVRRFRIVKSLQDYDPDAKPSMTPFMSPLIDGAYAADLCNANDKRSISKRVVDVKDSTKLTAFIIVIINEFVDKFCKGRKHFLHPLDIEDVYARQDTPAQRSILDRADIEVSQERRVEAFMKREAYQNVTDPRNISTINGVDKRDYSTFMYSLSDYIKEFDWYAFGKKPYEIAERVAVIAKNSTIGIIETDFSRMDGRVGEIPRMLERVLCTRLFHTKYHPVLWDLLRSQTNLVGKTKFNVKYDTGNSRLSGSPETSVFNTILNVFTAYLTFRRTKVQGKYIGKQQAWDRLGVYGGDDGLTADADEATYSTSATLVGQCLTSEMKPRGHTNVKFLARLYGPEVWFGDSTSICDLVRTMSKFHTTVTLPKSITAIDKLVDKAYSLSLTDGNTPVVGPFVNKVLEFKKENFTFRNFGRKWNVELDKDVQYPNAYADWMDDYRLRTLELFDHERFYDWLSKVNTLDDLLKCPCMMIPIDPIPVLDAFTIVDGVVEGSPVAVTDKDISVEKTSVEGSDKRFRTRKPKKDRVSRQGKEKSAFAAMTGKRSSNHVAKLASNV